MVHYKLYYFPVRGKGEAIRQIFKLAGEEFEEQTVSMEEWPQLKPGKLNQKIRSYETNAAEHVLPHLEKYAPLIEKFLVENGNNGLLIGDKQHIETRKPTPV
uniref:glutathione transferase n=1 Tax=Heterorhabditis bacteriophora TaxID=37862 RepID=A0A1I7W9H2_HETBA